MIRGDRKSRAATVARVSGMIAAYAIEALIGRLRHRDRNERLEFFSRNVGKWSARALRCMNVEVEVIGRDERLMSQRNFLMVSNHQSYLDILILSSVEPAVFVTSVDMGEVPFLGQMAELGGSIFVERRHRGRIGRDLKVMSDTLRGGHNVMLYPEGTSSNGERLLPFKKGLFPSAVEAECDILPICLKYVEIDDEPFGAHNADKVCWYGDMAFGPHFLGVLGLQKLKVELHFLPPIEVNKHSSRQELAERAHRAIEARMRSDLTLPHKPRTGTGVPASKVEMLALL